MLSHTQKIGDEMRGEEMGREYEKREKMRRLEEKGRRNQRGMIVILLVRNQ